MSNTTLYVEYMKTVKTAPAVSTTTIVLGFAVIVVIIAVL